MKRLIFVLLSLSWLAMAAAAPSAAQGVPQQTAGTPAAGTPAAGSPAAGIPLIRHFPLREFSGTQVVDIALGSRGLIYFTDTNYGLFEYDGEHWRQYDLPDFAVTVEEDADGRLWVAGPSNLGYMDTDELGRLVYNSLLDHLPEEQRSFSEVWPVMPTSRGVFFMAREFLFRWDGSRFSHWPGTVDEIFYRAYEIDGRLFFAQLGVGLLELVDDQLIPIGGDSLAESAEINAMFSRGDGTSWVITRLHGVFLLDGKTLTPIDTPASSWLIENQVQHGCTLPEGRMAIASRRGGLAIVDNDLRLLKTLDESAGLSSSKASYVKTDHQGNLWTTTNAGIDRIILDTSVVLFGPEVGLSEGVHQVIRHRDRLWVGADLGLFVEERDRDGNLSFSAIPELPTATWQMISDGEVVLAATTDGVFEVRSSGNRGVSLSLVRRLSYDGTQLIHRLKSSPDNVLVALPNGLARIERRGEQWNWAGRIESVEHEIRAMAENDDGDVLAWVPSLDTLKIIRFPDGLDAPPAVSDFQLDGGGLFDLPSKIVRHNGETYERFLGSGISTESGRPFETDPELAFLSDDYLLMLHDRAGRYWVLGDQGLGFAEPDGQGGARFRPLAARPIDGFVNVFEDPDREGTFWVGTAEGLYRWNDQAIASPRAPSTTLIRRVSLLKDEQELYAGGGTLADLPVLPFESNNLRFEFAAPIYDQQLPVEYQVRLDGFDTDWSPWAEESFKEYTNLPEGSYSFRVRARDSWGNISHEALFGFQILAPWYRTPWGYACGFLLAISLVLLGVQWRSRGDLRERQRLENLVQARTEELAEGMSQMERQAKALESANRQLAEENEHRRLLEDERSKLQLRIEQSQKLESLGLVAGGVAHDFNNILMAILGNADLALEDSSMDPAHLRTRLQEIRRASHRAAELCRHMLAYAGKGPTQKKEVDLSSIVLDCLEMVRAGAPHEVYFELDLLENPPAVMADDTQLSQVAMNLMLNAVESFEKRPADQPKGTIRVSTGARNLAPEIFQETVLADPLPGGPYVFLRVDDNGTGMDEDTVKRIFDPFFTTKFTGRGLGLAATLGIVKGHAGAVRVHSEVGEGTSIEIFLPALDHQADPSSSRSSEEIRSWQKTGTVLVVDDEKIVRDVVSVMLRNTGFDVLSASSSDQAMDIFARRHGEIVAVIMDLTMPDTDGQATFHLMREIDPDVKVVLSTGYTGDEIAERYLAEGFAGFLHKPYRANALREILKSVLED